jgi:hypothetical protein
VENQDKSPPVPSMQARSGGYNSLSSPRVNPVRKTGRRVISDRLSQSVGSSERKDTEEQAPVMTQSRSRPQKNGFVPTDAKSDQPNTPIRRRISSVELRERLKNSDGAFEPPNKGAEEFEVKTTSAASVVVPFAEVIPERVLKVKRQKEKAKIGEQSFSDLKFDNGFSDLYDGL